MWSPECVEDFSSATWVFRSRTNESAIAKYCFNLWGSAAAHLSIQPCLCAEPVPHNQIPTQNRQGSQEVFTNSFLASDAFLLCPWDPNTFHWVCWDLWALPKLGEPVIAFKLSPPCAVSFCILYILQIHMSCVSTVLSKLQTSSHAFSFSHVLKHILLILNIEFHFNSFTYEYILMSFTPHYALPTASHSYWCPFPSQSLFLFLSCWLLWGGNQWFWLGFLSRA